MAMRVSGQARDVLTTERLVGRRLTAADEPLFLSFHRDARVLRWLGGGDEEITEQENREWLDEKLRHWELHGFGLYALFELVPEEAPVQPLPDEQELVDYLVYRPQPARRAYRIFRTESGFRVTGRAPEPAVLEAILKAAGAREGDEVELGDEVLEWG